VPVEQVDVAFASVQSTPHAAQLARVLRSVSQPFALLPSQSPVPGLQPEQPHVPDVQVGVPLGQLQTVVHTPQWSTLEAVLVSQPLPGLPSQFPHPAEHVGVQTPDTQEVEPLALVHAPPQPPQFVVVVSGVSHPFTALPSQLPKPVAHTGVHFPATHEVVPLELTHAIPHDPQLAASVCVLVSHPFATLPSQLAAPALQVGVHTPTTQAVVPLAFAQAVPHVPQFAVVFSEVSHPSITLSLQSPKPTPQEIEQLPSVHDGVPLVLLHGLPHAPQWLVLLFVSVSHPVLASPSQSPNAAAHPTMLHVPEEQLAVALAGPHALPHAPQSVSVFRLVSHPSDAVPLQFPQPASHAPSWHAPPKQAGAPCAKLHTVAQVPQCCTFVVRFVSQPLIALLSQFPYPVSQAIAQVPLPHEPLPLMLPHAIPHAPQWLALVFVLVSQPLAVLLSQSPHPAEQAPNLQEPVSHVAVALGKEHGVPHAPQFATVLRLVSQPLFGSRSQFS
jgi:hypothetical protein